MRVPGLLLMGIGANAFAVISVRQGDHMTKFGGKKTAWKKRRLILTDHYLYIFEVRACVCEGV